MRRSATAAEVIGARVLLVHAIDDRAADFYRRFGFVSSPTAPRSLQMLISDIEASS
ncbi:MAG: hypothetical protein ACR2K6_09380 [Solirubrobacterales bacterium]